MAQNFSYSQSGSVTHRFIACLAMALIAVSNRAYSQNETLPTVETLNVDEARKVIVDNDFGGYFDRLQIREIATLTGKQVSGDLDSSDDTLANLRQARSIARERFQAAVLPFMQRESESILWCVNHLKEILAPRYPRLANQPWRFIKVKNSHCAGFSHTRSDCIILSQRTVDRIVEARQLREPLEALGMVGGVLVHEQLHVMQRLNRELFAKLYEGVWGFRSVKPFRFPHELEQNQVLNPDALQTLWAIPPEMSGIEDRTFVCTTVLKPGKEVARMGFDFDTRAVEVKRSLGGDYEVVMDAENRPVSISAGSLTALEQNFGIRRGLDHPNELSAYLFESTILRPLWSSSKKTLDNAGDEATDTSSNEEAKVAEPGSLRPSRVVKFQKWCKQNL